MVYSWKVFERSSCSTGVQTSHTSILQSQSCQSCQYCWSHIQWPHWVCSQSAGSNALMALTNQTKLDYYNQDLLSWITQLILDLSRNLERVRLELKHLTWWNSIKISSRKGCFILHCYLSSTAEVYNPSGGQTHSLFTQMHSFWLNKMSAQFASITWLRWPYSLFVVMAAVALIILFFPFSPRLPFSIFLLPFPCANQTGRTGRWELSEENDPDLWEEVIQKPGTKD